MKRYRRLKGRDTWHWMARCQHVRGKKRWAVEVSKRPRGDKCNECRRLEKRA